MSVWITYCYGRSGRGEVYLYWRWSWGDGRVLSGWLRCWRGRYRRRCAWFCALLFGWGFTCCSRVSLCPQCIVWVTWFLWRVFSSTFLVRWLRMWDWLFIGLVLSWLFVVYCRRFFLTYLCLRLALLNGRACLSFIMEIRLDLCRVREWIMSVGRLRGRWWIWRWRIWRWMWRYRSLRFRVVLKTISCRI